MTSISRSEYEQRFAGKQKEALLLAHDIRKFEIEHYWKRATYFWTLIGATMVGFLAADASAAENSERVSVILCCLGVVFSCAWFYVNKGSKYWQVNWETHVDLLEDHYSGPLYKTVLTRKNSDRTGPVGNYIWGAKDVSISKINQITSFFVFVLWVILLIFTVPIDFSGDLDPFYTTLIIVTVVISYLFHGTGGKSGGSYDHDAIPRTSKVAGE